VDSHINDRALNSHCAVKIVVPPWEKIPNKHDRSSHSYCQGRSLVARQESQEWVEAAKLQNANKVAKAVEIKAQEQACYDGVQLPVLWECYEIEAEGQHKAHLECEKQKSKCFCHTGHFGQG